MQLVKTNFDKPYRLNRLPNECPHCNSSIVPIPLLAFVNRDKAEVFMKCPGEGCEHGFIAIYIGGNDRGDFVCIAKTTNFLKKEFEEEIKEISLSFCLIYNEAYAAEQNDLFQICGVDYRKALEFLIKDYVIIKNEDKKESILKMPLASCISKYINNEQIKSVSKRAVWLGNDETHYLRKWESKNVYDLKKLIELIVHWIEMEKLTESLETDMPE